MQTSSSFLARRGGSAAPSARTRVRARYSHRPPRVNHAETVPRPGSSARSTRAGSAFPSATLAQERDPRLPCTGAGTPSPLRFGAAGHGSGSDRPVRPPRGAPTAPPLPCCAVTDRGSARGLGGAGEVSFVAHLRHAAAEATKAHRLLALGVPAK